MGKNPQNNVVIVGESPHMKEVYSVIRKVAPFSATIMLTGESGVGKNRFANMIHNMSERSGRAFVTINCGAIPESLLESELFGYEKGAFTGANQSGKVGIIETADNGTLFLDEIGDLPLPLQVKLLKVIQEKKITRVGGTGERDIDFRLVAATNKDIKALTEEGVFRKDLFYRLNVISLHIPPLRERREDIKRLVEHFTEKFNAKYGLNRRFSNKAVKSLEAYSWPGNVRELENVVERAILTAEDDEISEKNLERNFFSKIDFKDNIGTKKLKEILADVEKTVILDSYKKHGTTVKVAKELGISQASVSIKLKKYQIGDADK